MTNVQKNQYNIVTLGGGTGSFTVLSGLLPYSGKRHVTAITTAYDDGGSTGELVDQLGVLPAGDLRRCFLAMSPVKGVWRKIFNHRLKGDVRSGGVAGHVFGNLFMATVEDLYGPKEMLSEVKALLQVTGDVLPVSFHKAQLAAILSDGSRIVGQSKITTRNRYDLRTIESLEFEESPKISEEAARAIIEADVIVLCPGSFYTSLMACLITPGVYEAIAQSRAQIVWIPNLMNHPAETRNYTIEDFATCILKVLPRKRFNAVLLDNGDNKIPDTLLKQYADKTEEVLVADWQIRRQYARDGVPWAHRVVSGDFLCPENIEKDLIRHWSSSLACEIVGIAERPARKTFVVGINDVLVQTTDDMRGAARAPKDVSVVAGAAAFLEAVRAYGHILIALSRVRKVELVDGEYEKLKVAGLYHLCPEIRIVVGREELVRAVRDMAHAEGERMVLIGDCPQYELVTAAQNGCHTIVRMKLPVRAYFEEDCGRVTYSVTSFEDSRLMDSVTSSG